MPELSSGAWIGLICLGGVILTSGLVLWSTWRQRGKGSKPGWMAGSAPSFTRAWKKEDDQLRELAEKVRNLGSDKKDST